MGHWALGMGHGAWGTCTERSRSIGHWADAMNRVSTIVLFVLLPPPYPFRRCITANTIPTLAKMPAAIAHNENDED